MSEGHIPIRVSHQSFHCFEVHTILLDKEKNNNQINIHIKKNNDLDVARSCGGSSSTIPGRIRGKP